MLISKYKMFINKVRNNIPFNKGVKELISQEIYGTIIVMALLLYFLGYETDHYKVIIKLVGTVTALGFAEAYAQFIGAHIEKMGFISKEELRRLFRLVWEVVLTAIVPCILILVSKAGAFSLDVAIQISVVFGVLSLFFYGLVCAEVSRFTTVGKILFAMGSGCVGIFAIVFKYFLH